MEKIKTLKMKISEGLPTDEDKLQMILTLMGVGAYLTKFIVDHTYQKTWDVKTRYAMALIAGNMFAFFSNEPLEKLDLHSAEDDISEQTEEAIYRKLKTVVEILYKSLKEDEEVL